MNSKEQKTRKGTDEIRETIDTTIKEIRNIPDIKSNQLGLNTEKIKDDLIPQLEKQKNRLDDFDKIDEYIDNIRKEIINPVNEVIEKNSATSRKVNILFGAVGVAGTLFTMIGLYIALKGNGQPDNSNSSRSPSHIEKNEANNRGIQDKQNSFKELRGLFSDNFSKECLDLTVTVKEQIGKIEKDLPKANNKELEISRDELLKSTIAIESNGCTNRFITNGLYDDIYKVTAAICYKIDDNTILSALIGQYNELEYEKDKEAKFTLDLFSIELEYKESNNENKYIEELKGLYDKKEVVNIISPTTLREVALKSYLKKKIDEIELKSEKEKFEVWVFDAPKIQNSQVSPFVKELQNDGFKKVIKKGVIDGTWQIPWMYYKNSTVRNSPLYEKVVGMRNKYNIKRSPEIYTNSKYGIIKNYFELNENLKIIVIL